MAVALKGSLFNSANDVVLVVSYITRLSWKSHKKYQSSLGTSLYSLMKLFLIRLRNSGYSVLWLGDLNGCTKSCGGWSGQEPLFSSFVEGTRSSKCQKDLDREGREILSICEASECCILNGLKLDDAPLTSSSSVTRPACMAKDRVQDVVNFESEDEEELLGTVLDYYISSADLLSQFESLEVLPKERF